MSKKIFISVTDEMHEALKKLAGERGASVSGLARRVLAEHLEGEGRPVNWSLEWGGGGRKKGKGEDRTDEELFDEAVQAYEKWCGENNAIFDYPAASLSDVGTRYVHLHNVNGRLARYDHKGKVIIPG